MKSANLRTLANVMRTLVANADRFNCISPHSPRMNFSAPFCIDFYERRNDEPGTMANRHLHCGGRIAVRAKKIPELARALGKAKGEFKKGLLEGAKDDPSEGN